MVKSLALSEDWDIQLDSNNNLNIIDDKKRVAQDVACACRLFLGECIFFINKGIPYFDDILAVKPNFELLKSYLEDAALIVPNVEAVEIISYNFNNRNLAADIRITDNLDTVATVNNIEQLITDNFYIIPDVYNTANIYRIKL